MQTQGTAGASAPPGEEISTLERLLLQLERNLETLTLSLQEQRDALTQVKTFGRNPQTATPIFTQQAISVLSQYALDLHKSNEASREALRCLANAFLLHEPSRQVFVDLGYGPKAADRLTGDDADDEFLIARILFYLTYNTTLDFQILLDQHGLAENIHRHISRHATRYSKPVKRDSATASRDEAAMSETCKLMFNVTYHYPGSVSKFTPAIEPLITILLLHDLPRPPLQSPTNYLLNALLNLDLQAAEKKTPLGREARSSPMFPYSDAESLVNRLINILDAAIRQQPEPDLEQAAAPLCTLLRRLYELATSQMKAYMRWLLLPNPKDRDRPLGQGDTLSSRLLRLSCSPNLPSLRGNISALLFELSDKDATKFVQNIGYGFASGFLMSQNIQVSANAADASSSSSLDGFNPITGQRLSAESREELGMAMTEEEKEREAERLFVLFERLKATGVVDVKNPVEGRFEEID
ncbi:hypothetical protein CERZMDRAFT_112974 [Cercospora zeae-maydis SCOH1-5]|uniref:Uncharacterized protein n=1 Tax=Cercospora zeae-maydis SCOH1-5 TaxID=717836 RepID=A0A6A6FBM8_9PEZI|nr:hypothetical protein CERZMDRAFT_112974 [Cercospora zeae-maydis SCOH1-5]